MSCKPYLDLAEKESATSSKPIKAAQDALIAKVAAKYAQLSEDEIKTLVVDDKWLAHLAADVQRELDRVSQTLTGRIRQLADATPARCPSSPTKRHSRGPRGRAPPEDAREMEQKPGFKRTEIGVIPEKWRIDFDWRRGRILLTG